MAAGSPSPGPGRDEDPARRPRGAGDPLQDAAAGWRPVPSPGPDWLDDPGRLVDPGEEPPDPAVYPDPDDPPLPGEVDLAAVIAEAGEITAEQSRAAAHAARLGTTGALASVGATLGRRGPGLPGSAHRFPGEYSGPGAGFASGMALDTAPGCPELALFAGDAAGDDDAYAGVSDDELVGAICGWDRVEAHAAARKHAALAELIRRRPARDYPVDAATRLPLAWDEFTATELSYALAESGQAAEEMLELAWDLETKLPGTRAAFRSGVLRESKVAIIVRACEVLDPAEARAAEALVLDRAGRLTPGGLRSAIARAVMQVAPDKARKRREQAARDARVERWAEDSGNAALVGRELPPADVLAADQRVTAWAAELKKAGLDGSTDELRARAYLDLLLGVDSRPPGGGSPGVDSRPPGDGSPGVDSWPTGFAARGNLTVPLATLTELADRPGELGGIGPVDPWLARDLASAAARHPATTWCVTVTDAQGHAIGHGCARPAARGPREGRRTQDSPGGPDPPGGAGGRDGPRFSFTRSDQPGPPGGYGTWRLRTGTGQDLVVAIEPIATEDCDHRFRAAGHDPGRMLRHLTQIRHATCVGPTCRRPAARCDFDHGIPYEAGGPTCSCNGTPKCRHEHRLKQDPRWKAEQVTPALVRWTTPAGRQYTTEPTRYPT
jgi:hypothetical protein